MKKFENMETTLISKWYGSQIDIFINDSQNVTLEKNDLISKLSELIQDLINEDLKLLSEGYISEIIHQSVDKVDYHALIDYYKSE